MLRKLIVCVNSTFKQQGGQVRFQQQDIHLSSDSSSISLIMTWGYDYRGNSAVFDPNVVLYSLLFVRIPNPQSDVSYKKAKKSMRIVKSLLLLSKQTDPRVLLIRSSSKHSYINFTVVLVCGSYFSY